MTTAELKQEARDKVREALERAAAHYGIQLPMPTILFNLRGRAAGQANGDHWRIRFNMALLEQNKEKFLERTPVHEAAHLIVRKRYGNHRSYSGRRVVKPHGSEWESVMRFLGVDPKRCHNFATDNCGVRRRGGGKKYVYRCGCRDLKLGAIQHRRAISGVPYRCRRCNGSITFTGQTAEQL